jgi:hypothetical protein
VSVKRIFLWAVAGMALATSLAASAQAAAVYVQITPPRPLVERVLRRPGSNYVWVGGYYHWSGRSYIWVPGRWTLPPRPAAVWVAPHWDYVPSRRAYVFAGGVWR